MLILLFYVTSLEDYGLTLFWLGLSFGILHWWFKYQVPPGTRLPFDYVSRVIFGNLIWAIVVSFLIFASLIVSGKMGYYIDLLVKLGLPLSFLPYLAVLFYFQFKFQRQYRKEWTEWRTQWVEDFTSRFPKKET